LPSIVGDDFAHPDMARFGLPSRYSEIDWSDRAQKSGYVAFLVWLIGEMLANMGEAVLQNLPEGESAATALAKLDQLHAQLREMARDHGIVVEEETRAPFDELDD
jgi:hypothetical protein